MSVNVFTARTFDKEIKRLSKKYKSLKSDLMNFVLELRDNPNMGVSLSGNVRKIRMQISDKNKGKRGGARIITYNFVVSVDATDVTLLYVYDKNERSSISMQEIDDLIKEAGLNK